MDGQMLRWLEEHMCKALNWASLTQKGTLRGGKCLDHKRERHHPSDRKGDRQETGMQTDITKYNNVNSASGILAYNQSQRYHSTTTCTKTTIRKQGTDSMAQLQLQPNKSINYTV